MKKLSWGGGGGFFKRGGGLSPFECLWKRVDQDWVIFNKMERYCNFKVTLLYLRKKIVKFFLKL